MQQHQHTSSINGQTAAAENSLAIESTSSFQIHYPEQQRFGLEQTERCIALEEDYQTTKPESSNRERHC